MTTAATTTMDVVWATTVRCEPTARCEGYICDDSSSSLGSCEAGGFGYFGFLVMISVAQLIKNY